MGWPSLVALGALAGAAMVLARRARGHGGLGGRRRALLAVVAQTPLAPRRAVALIRVGSRHFVLAHSEAGFALLGEVALEAEANIDQGTHGLHNPEPGRGPP